MPARANLDSNKRAGRRPFGQGQYLWDEDDRRYIDLLGMSVLGMNVCISVGHAHPKVVRAAAEQMAEL